MVIITDVNEFLSQDETPEMDIDGDGGNTWKNISYITSSGKYIIRKTKKKVTYYYGSYGDFDECKSVCLMLNRLDFPIVLSQDMSRYHGRSYYNWLKNELRKKGFNL